jgi:hypothetical protein
VWSLRLFPNLLLLAFCKIMLFFLFPPLLSHSVDKRNISMGTWEHIKKKKYFHGNMGTY